MSTTKQAFESANSTAFATFAEAVTVTLLDDSTYESYAVIRYNVEVMGDFGGVIDRRTEITLLSTDTVQVERGCLISNSTETFQLLELLEDYPLRSKWAASRRSGG